MLPTKLFSENPKNCRQCLSLNHRIKGIVHPKMKILSSFTHPQVVPNLHDFLSSAEHKRRYFKE